MRRCLVLLLVALLLLLWSSLTGVRAGNVPVWMLALVAGEWGHYGAVAAVLVALAAGVAGARTPPRRGVQAARGFAVLTALVAAMLFLRPVLLASRVAQELPGQVRAAFPGAGGASFDLNWHRLWLPAKEARVAVEEYVFSGAGTRHELRLDFHRAASAGAAPCVVAIHGGGWDGGDRRQFAASHHALARDGYAVAAISYRLAPEHRWPSQREDTLVAIAWLKAHAVELGIDASCFVLFGRSAGGQIATAVGYGAADPAIRGVVAFYAPHDLRFVWSIAREDDVLNSVKLMQQYLGGAPDGDREALYDSASGQQMVTPRTPPTLLVHGTLDELVWVEHSRRLAARLQESGVPVLFVELPWATHAFDYFRPGPGGQLSEQALKVFLRVVVAK